MLDKLKKLDWTLVFILLLFAAVSTSLIYSATIDNPNYQNYYLKNIINYAIGFLVFFTVNLVDYRYAVKYYVVLYLSGILLLVSLFYFGKEINGAKSWFNLPMGFSFQPAELMKIILILTIAAFLARREFSRLNILEDVLPLGILVLIPFVLVILQPDLGNAIIYLVIFLGMLWVGNIKYTHVLLGLGVFVALLAAFLYFFTAFHDAIYAFFESKNLAHWVTRIDTFISPETVSEDAKYQVDNSMRAIGSGGLFGDGYLNGNSIHNGFIPYPYSDSIFVVVGEEFGFLGGSLLLLLYFWLIYRMIVISISCSDLSGVYVIAGIVSMFVFQIFENVGMLLGIMPLTGITLPFVSYGGTSLLINMLAMGLVMSIKIHEKEPEEV